MTSLPTVLTSQPLATLSHLSAREKDFLKTLSHNITPKASPQVLAYALGALVDKFGPEVNLTLEQVRILLAQSWEESPPITNRSSLVKKTAQGRKFDPEKNKKKSRRTMHDPHRRLLRRS